MIKLPEPVELNPTANSVKGYTEAQVLQFRKDVLEEAALVCEERSRTQIGELQTDGQFAALCLACAIRKLKEQV